MSSNIQTLALVVPLMNTCRGHRVLAQQLFDTRLIGGEVRLTHFLSILLPQTLHEKLFRKKKIHSGTP